MDTSALDDLIQSCGYPGESGAHPLAPSKLAPILGSSSREEFCDAFSRRVASQYAAGRLAFGPADAAMNRLWEYAFLGDENFIPDFSRQVFEAFDEGEYIHEGDPSDTDPDLKYTRPRIAEILGRGERL